MSLTKGQIILPALKDGCYPCRITQVTGGVDKNGKDYDRLHVTLTDTNGRHREILVVVSERFLASTVHAIQVQLGQDTEQELDPNQFIADVLAHGESGQFLNVWQVTKDNNKNYYFREPITKVIPADTVDDIPM